LLIPPSLLPPQPWYEHLEALRYLLPEEDAKDKFTGESWPAKLQRLAERQLVALEDDERRYKEVRGVCDVVQHG
jgi:hypothetical protein